MLLVRKLLRTSVLLPLTDSISANSFLTFSPLTYLGSAKIAATTNIEKNQFYSTKIKIDNLHQNEA